jgi:protein TonB
MFARLPESNASRQRRTGGFVVSTVVHLVLIALAVQATGLTAAPRPKPLIVDLVYNPPQPAQPLPPQHNVEARSSNASAPAVPAPPELPPAITDDIPTTLPEPGAMKVLLDHLFDATRVSMAGQSTGTPNVSDGSPLPENLVEKAVTAIPGTATPRYPSLLQSAGVQGNVRAQFVVDTLGQVEQGSFRVLEATHDLFTAAVRDALGRARFRPAEAGGRKVRQLVEQTFTFSITR